MTRYYELKLGWGDPTTVTVSDAGYIEDIAQETIHTRRWASGGYFKDFEKFVAERQGTLREIPEPLRKVQEPGAGDDSGDGEDQG